MKQMHAKLCFCWFCLNYFLQFQFPFLKCVYWCRWTEVVLKVETWSDWGICRNMLHPHLSPSFSPTSVFSSFPFYPREEGGRDQQAGVSSGGGAHVCQWREGGESVWWGLDWGLTCKFSGRKWCVIMAVLLTARQQLLCVMEQRKWGGGSIQGVCVGKLTLICFQAFLHLEWQPGAPRLI